MARDLKLTASLKNNVSKEIDKIIQDMNRLAQASGSASSKQVAASQAASRAIVSNEEKALRARISLQRQSAALADRQEKTLAAQMKRANAKSLTEERDKAEATLRIQRRAAIEEASLIENRFDRRIAIERVRHQQRLIDFKGNNAAQEAEMRRHGAVINRIQMDKANFSKTPFQQLLGRLGGGGGGGGLGRGLGGMMMMAGGGASSGLGKGLGSMMMMAGGMGGPVGLLAGTMGAIVGPSVDVANKMNAVTKSLKFATGSAVAGAKEFAFLRAEAYRLGVSAIDIAPGFAKLAAAARGTAIEGATTRDIFRGITEASVALSLTGDETAGALNAIQQMISKGSIQAEELRGQLGERLPGAFQGAAAAMGVTTRDLSKMLEQGMVPMEKFLPRFAEQLHQTYGKSAVEESENARASIARFHSTVASGSSIIGEATVQGYGAMAKYLDQIFSNGWKANEAAKALNKTVSDAVKNNPDIAAAKAEEVKRRSDLNAGQKESLDAMIEDDKSAAEQQKAIQSNLKKLKLELIEDETQRAIALSKFEMEEGIKNANGYAKSIELIKQEHALRVLKINQDAARAQFEDEFREALEKDKRDADFRKRMADASKREQDEAIAADERWTQKEYEESEKRKKIVEEESKAKLNAAMSFTSGVANLLTVLGRKNRALAKAAQVINIADAIANTAVGVTKALSAAPPPWNFIQAASVGLAGAAQVATISQQRFARGTDSAPGGMALVGEFGPERVFLPKGSRVQTAQETKSSMGITHNGPVSINVSIASTVSSQEARRIGSDIGDGYIQRLREFRQMEEDAEYRLGKRR